MLNPAATIEELRDIVKGLRLLDHRDFRRLLIARIEREIEALNYAADVLGGPIHDQAVGSCAGSQIIPRRLDSEDPEYRQRVAAVAHDMLFDPSAEGG